MNPWSDISPLEANSAGLPADKTEETGERHLFISDVHYGMLTGAAANRLHEDLISLLARCREQQVNLTVLGDFFDWWMEYPDGTRPRFAEELLEAFREYMQVMGPVLFITGNHDNWTRSHLGEIGFDLESEYRRIRLDGVRGLLLHGDGLAETRFGLPRPFWHRILRHPTFVRLYQSLLPPKAGFEVMRRVSEWNRKKVSDDPDRLSRWARIYLGKNDLEFVICGHDHVPRTEHFPGGTLYNCGAFVTHRTAVEYNNRDGFRIVIWNRDQKRFRTMNRRPRQIQTS